MKKKFLVIPLVVLSTFVLIVVVYSFVHKEQQLAFYAHPATEYCLQYPKSWTRSEYNEGALIVPYFLDKQAKREGVSSNNQISDLRDGSYIEIIGENIPEDQRDLPIFSPSGQLENTLAGGALQLRSRKDITIDGETGLLATIDPKPADSAVNAGAAGLYRITGSVRHGDIFYYFTGFSGTKSARDHAFSTAQSILRSFKFPEHCDSSTQSTSTLRSGQTSAMSLDNTIKQYVVSNAAPSIQDVSITNKMIITDEHGIQWMKFEVLPVPANATDPAYGVMKNVNGVWEGVGFGTCCVEQQLTVEVGEALGFDMSFKKE